MTTRFTTANHVTAFSTGWPEQLPQVMVLSLTTLQGGVQDFLLNKEQALSDRKDHQGNRRAPAQGEAGLA